MKNREQIFEYDGDVMAYIMDQPACLSLDEPLSLYHVEDADIFNIIEDNLPYIIVEYIKGYNK